MKNRLFALTMSLLLAFCCIGCGGTSATSSPMDAPDKYLDMRLSDVISVNGNKQMHSLDAYNISKQYINGIVIANAYDENDKLIDSATILMQNLEPGFSASDFVNIPIGVTVENVEYDILRLDAADQPVPSPEITDENIYDYIYLTHEPMGKIDYGQATFNADLHNLTTQYFSGTILYTITDAEDNVLLATMETYTNVNPGSKEALVDGAIPADEYIVSYEVLEYQFTDEPI